MLDMTAFLVALMVLAQIGYRYRCWCQGRIAYSGGLSGYDCFRICQAAFTHLGEGSINADLNSR